MKLGDRFWSKVEKTGDCWLWRSVLNGDGYSRYSLNGRKKAAHRLAYEELVGPIPAGLQIDHKCRNRSCVNPSHLEPVTQRENIMRGNGAAALALRGELAWNHQGARPSMRLSHCRKGHELTPENIYQNPRGDRLCRRCKADYGRVYRQRQKEGRAEAT